MPTKITLIPSLPAEGWLSMNRHWQAMNSLTAGYKGTEFSFRCPLRYRDLLTKRSGRLHLTLEKKILYPARIRAGARSGIAHILDHSYAFLIPSVPKGVKTVVTVHDLLPLREPDGIGQAAVRRFRRRIEWIKAADLILSDSSATKGDLMEFLSLREERIHVLPLGVRIPEPERTALPTISPHGQFLLSVGGFMKRKNLEILPQILEAVRKNHPFVRLIRAGGRLPAEIVSEFERRCGADALLELGQITDDDLSVLYGSAVATLVPSRYEGFGLPILEAMAQGCPVVCSNTTSLPEVGGEAALYHEVDDAIGAARQVLRILDSGSEWLWSLRREGRARAGNFSWDIHYERLLEIYRNLSRTTC